MVTSTEVAKKAEKSVENLSVEKKEEQQQQQQAVTAGSENDKKPDENDVKNTDGSKKKRKRNKKSKSLKPISERFPDQIFPCGEFIINGNVHKSEEDRPNDEPNYERLNHLRKAAEVHRRVREIMRPEMKVGTDLEEFCTKLENTTRRLVSEDKMNAGIAFPTGVSINECAAHYTPNIGEKRVIQKGDIVKIDFGVHSNGHLIDSAFTVNLDPVYEPLRQATIDATNAALKLAGPDAYIRDISATIQEVIESFEVHLPNNTVLQVKPVRNLNGHQIDRKKIHAGVSIPLIKENSNSDRLQAGTQYAIETFATTGSGIVKDSGEVTHFMAPDPFNNESSSEITRTVARAILNHHDTMAFCQRMLKDKLGDMSAYKIQHGINMLVKQGLIAEYPPLCDVKGSKTSQMEHTLFVNESGIEVLSRGSDF